MYLGLDFGTSSVKGVIIDDKQKLIATALSPLKVSRPHPGWSEQNPEDWWKAATAVVKALRKAVPELWRLADIEVRSLSSKDSSQITPRDWVALARMIASYRCHA